MSAMNIYIVKRLEGFKPTWDEWVQFVVVAANEQRAREVIYEAEGGRYIDHERIWLNPMMTKVEMVGSATEGRGEGVLVESYQAG